MDVEIHTTSAFSFLRGASLPEDLAERAADLGYGAVALLDRDGFYGTPRFHKAATARGVRAIVGTVLHVTAAGVRGALGLYVRDAAGYKALCRLITTAKLRTPKPRAVAEGVTVTLDEVAEVKSGLAAVLLAGEAPLATLPRGTSPAIGWARAVAGVFGREACYVEQSRHLERGEARVMLRLAHLAGLLKLRCIATNDARYATPAGRAAADVLACARAHVTLAAAGKLLEANAERHVKPPAALRELFRDAPECVANAAEFAATCGFTLCDLGYRFPEFPLGPGETADGRLAALVADGARGRYGAVHPRAYTQLARELALIAKLGLAGYFLVVWDVTRECRARGIMAQGRGSAANSAVCYALGITAVDPVGMDLLFERFLSEERGEWPDIDLDLPSGDRREAIIQYVYGRYGARGAAMTANVITYRARSAVRECAKALGFPPEMIDALGRGLHPWGALDRDGLAGHFAGAGLDCTDPRVVHLGDAALRVQNLPRHLGQHSGGMVLAAGRLDEVCPLEPATMPGRVVVQWDKDDCADLGILKVDLLGLGMLALLEEAVPMVRAHDGVALDLAHLPPDDPDTYAMLGRADTVGVFQVESRAQMATLPRMRPARFYDLVVEVAIIRPGPIVGNLVHPYMNRRLGREPVTYAHPDLEPILARTLGVPLFQEQLMRVAMVAAGFTGGEAEELRRAMGSKRSVERMVVLEAKLRAGMARNGFGPAARDDVVRGITSFALYGFPESHAASFALLAYASAYLKCHFPATFACALLNQWPMGFYHPATIVKDAQRHGVRVLPIDVTRSEYACARVPGGEGRARGDSSERGAVQLGLQFVAGLRAETARAIARERARAAFESIDALARRTGARGEELATLAELGALASVPRDGGPVADARVGAGASAGGDGLRWTRRSALWQVRAVAAKPPGGLFDRAETADEPAGLAEMSLEERVAADYRASGITVGPHPMALRRAALAARGVASVAHYIELPDGSAASVAGAVITRQHPETAKGFFFMTLEDETGLANAIVTPSLFETQRAVLVTAPFLVLHGVVQQRDGVTSLKVALAEALGADDPIVALPPSHDFH